MGSDSLMDMRLFVEPNDDHLRVPCRWRTQALQNVAELTGWNIDEMRRRMHLNVAVVTPPEKKWWEKIW